MRLVSDLGVQVNAGTLVRRKATAGHFSAIRIHVDILFFFSEFIQVPAFRMDINQENRIPIHVMSKSKVWIVHGLGTKSASEDSGNSLP